MVEISGWVKKSLVVFLATKYVRANVAKFVPDGGAQV